MEAPRGRLIAAGRMHDHDHEWSDHSLRVLGLARQQIHAGRVFDAFALVSFAFTSENSAEDDRLRKDTEDYYFDRYFWTSRLYVGYC